MSRISKLYAIWAALNEQHFSGSLKPVTIRITRSRRTYGYFYGPNSGGRPSIRISTVLADTDELLRDTMAHEMIHQALHQAGEKDWHKHELKFQTTHSRVFGCTYVEESVDE